jgi:hypothetical protein
VKVRFQADADLNEDIVTGVLRRAPSIDFQTAKEAGLYGLEDPDVLALAALEGRVLVSHDRRTMPGHFGRFISASKSPGLLIVSQHQELSTVIEELMLIWAASESEEWLDRITVIPL